MAKAAVLQELPEVRILGEITALSAQLCIDELSAYRGQTVAISIFSDGGNVFGGNAVAAYISNPANGITAEARVYGNASSAAMIIAAACARAYISSGAFALVHKARAFDSDGVAIADGDLDKEQRNILDAINAEQVRLFARRTGMTPSAVGKLMEQDRLMPSDEAVDKGFFDGIIELGARIAAYSKINSMSENKQVRSFKVKVARTIDNIGAIATGGEVTVEIPEAEIDANGAQRITELDASIAALTKERDELKAAKEEAERINAEATAAKEALDTEVKAAREEAAKFKAEVETLRKTPIKAVTPPAGTAVVVPGNEEQKETRNMSAEEQRINSVIERQNRFFAERDKK